MESIKTIQLGEKTFNLNMDLFEENDYMKIQLFDDLEGQKVEITTTIVDKEGNKIFPIITEIVSNDELSDYDATYDITLIDDKCIFFNTQNCYVLDMNDIKFTFKDGLWVPEKYLLRCLVLYNIDNKKLIITNYDFSYLYDMKKGEVIGNIYDFIKPTKNKKKLENHYYIENEYINPLIIKIFTNINGKKENKVILNEILELYIKDEILEDEEKLKTYCDEAFLEYVEKTRYTPCISMQ